MNQSSITVLCGGVGAARLLAGLVQVVEPSSITAIVNTGDDTELHGLSISPDIDTITYTLAGAIDPERGWGLAGETWQALGALERYERVRPEGSDAAVRWFGLGDRDLATHLYRTQRLREGATLTEVTAEIARAWGLSLRVLPMTDDPVRTVVDTPSHGRLAFQEYFVRHRHALTVSAVDIVGAASARVPASVVRALDDADMVIIAPSNPLVSIGPLVAMPALESALRRSRDRTIAVSPIVGGRALKGPADTMLADAGIEPSALGVARVYAQWASTIVVDHVDEGLSTAIESNGIRCVVTDTVMGSSDRAAALAATVVAAMQ
jgi:LPPG:FO 2-phospho-L-lactate transferase